MSEIIKEELEVQGSITFANEVLATIAGIAAADIPGVAGIGEKTALKLIAEYGSLDALYDGLS